MGGSLIGDSGTTDFPATAEPEAEIKSLIYVVRDEQVMFDSDLAVLYGVETKNLNKAASRNRNRFPEDFRFRLTTDEFKSLRLQAGTSSAGGRGGRRYLPFVYTEQGIAMLSSVLHSDKAITASISIMRAFVEMRRFLVSNAQMFEQVRKMDVRQRLDQEHNEERFEQIFGYIEGHTECEQKVFFQGQIFDAFALLSDIVGRAEESIVLVDGYVGVDTLNILAKKREGVTVDVWVLPGKGPTNEDVAKFNAQYPQLTVHRTTGFHDRFLILDGKVGYHVGASLKDAGKRAFEISLIRDQTLVDAILANLWQAHAQH